MNSKQYSLQNYMKTLQIICEDSRQLSMKTVEQLIENVRLMAEFILYGQKYDNTYFDLFCQNQVLDQMHRLLQLNYTPVTLQVIQTISIMITNIEDMTKLYYLLSHQFINKLIGFSFNFSNDEIVDYYISFLKSLGLKLTPDTIKFFFNTKFHKFPLYDQAIKFYNHRDSMVKTAVKTIVLTVFRTKDPNVKEYLKGLPSAAFFANIACYLRDKWFRINQGYVGDLETIIMSSKKRETLWSLIQDSNQLLYFFQDIFDLGMDHVNTLLANALLYYAFLPTIIATICYVEKGEPPLHINFALYLLIQVFKVIQFKPIIDTLVSVMFYPKIHKDLIPYIQGDVPKAPASYCYNWRLRDVRTYSLPKYVEEFLNYDNLAAFVSEKNLPFLKELNVKYNEVVQILKRSENVPMDEEHDTGEYFFFNLTSSERTKVIAEFKMQLYEIIERTQMIAIEKEHYELTRGLGTPIGLMKYKGIEIDKLAVLTLMDSIFTDFEPQDEEKPKMPQVPTLKKPRHPSVSLGVEFERTVTASKKSGFHSNSEEQLPIHPNNDEEQIPIPEKEEGDLDEETKQNKSLVKNPFGQSFLMYLRSKDDNLILLTCGVLLNILHQKQVSIPLLDKVGLFPKSRIPQFVEPRLRSRSLMIGNVKNIEQEEKQGPRISEFSFSRSADPPFMNKDYNHEIIDLLVKLLMVDPPFRLITVKTIIQIISTLTFSEVIRPKRFMKHPHLTQLLTAYASSIKNLKNLFQEQDLSYFLSETFEKAWKDYKPMKGPIEFSQPLSNPFIMYYFYPEHQRCNFIPEVLKFTTRPNERAKRAVEHFQHLRYLRHILCSPLSSPNQYSPSASASNQRDAYRNHYDMLLEHLREYPTLHHEQDSEGKDDKNIQRWKEGNYYKLPSDRELLACYIKKGLKLLILDEEYFLLFDPDKNMKNSGQLLKKALLLNVDIMIDRSDPRTLMVGIKLPPKGFRNQPQYDQVELHFENSLHCLNAKKNLDMRKQHAKQYQMTLMLSILENCESDIENLFLSETSESSSPQKKLFQYPQYYQAN